MTSTYIKSLAHDYIDTIERISHGLFSDSAELYALESERSILHAQLEAAVSKRIKKDAMPEYARSLLR